MHTESTLHPRIVELIGELDASRAEFNALVGSLPYEILHAPAVGEEWSIAHVLEHLAMVEDGAGRLVSKLVHEAEASGARETETSSVLGVNDQYRIATADVRITAPERVRPTAGVAPEASLLRLQEAREKLKSVLARASGLALGSVAMPHPVFGPFTAYQWILANAQHERRHMRQIRRLAGMSAGQA